MTEPPKMAQPTEAGQPMAGRPMKAWVQVPPTHETQWADLARKAEAGLDG